MTTASTFDLLEEPWILATEPSGKVRELSLREVFREAGNLAALAGEIPTQEFAILRLLLAILYRSVRHLTGTPTEVWARLWELWPGEEIDSYLVAYRHRFQLFDPVAPFFQVAGLRSGKDSVSALDKLIADVPNGVKYFTTRAGREIERIGFAEAARWLVHVQAFDPSGIKTGADGDPRVKNGRGYPIGIAWTGNLGGVYLEGANLRQTLLLNLVLADLNGDRYSTEDLPPWEREPDGPGVRPAAAPNGPVDLYTWQSRRVRLVRSDTAVTGVVLCNGDALEPFNKHLLEPMTAWRYSENQSKKAGEDRHYPAVHDPEKSLWRGLRSILGDVAGPAPVAGRGIAPGVVEWLGLLLHRNIVPTTHPVRLHATGMHYINNASVVGDIIDDALGFSVAVLASDSRLRSCAVNAVQVAESAVDALASLAGNLAVAAGGDSAGARARAREYGFFALEAPYRRWLRSLDPRAPEHDYAGEWEQTVYPIVRGLGDELIESAGSPARTGREVREQWVDASQADIWFRKRLKDLLPAAFADRDQIRERKADDELVDVVW